MKKKELVGALSAKSGESHAVCERVLDALSDVAVPALVSGKSIPLTGLGKLTIKRLAARTLRSFGQQVDVPERPAVRFRPGKALKEAMGA